jgi:hypothetical protein
MARSKPRRPRTNNPSSYTDQQLSAFIPYRQLYLPYLQHLVHGLSSAHSSAFAIVIRQSPLSGNVIFPTLGERYFTVGIGSVLLEAPI